MKEQNEIESLVMLRGIASLGVCFLHFTGTVNSAFLKELGHYGGQGVYLFFIISAFIIPHAMQRSAYRVNDYFRFLLPRMKSSLVITL